MLTVIDYHRILIQDAAKQAHKSVCPLYKKDNSKYKLFGNGVLVSLEGKLYLLSAAHVFDGLDYAIYAPTSTHIFSAITGEFIVNSNTNRKFDKVDVGIFLLDEQTSHILLEKYVPLTKKNLAINHSVKFHPYYLAFGYPTSQTKYLYNSNEIISRPFQYITVPSNESIYTDLDCDSRFNILFQYDKNKVHNYSTRQFSVGPDTYGMSGSGIWYIPMQLCEDTHNVHFKLVSIVTEWPVKNRKHWISTRIDVFTEILKKEFHIDLPSSNLIEAKSSS